MANRTVMITSIFKKRIPTALIIGVATILFAFLSCELIGKCRADAEQLTCMEPSGHPVRCETSLVFPWGGPFGSITAALDNAREAGAFKFSDWKRLDFSKPGDVSFGKNPHFEVFNPHGPFHVDLHNGEVFPHLLANVGKNDSQIVYTIYQWPGYSILYGVITDVRPWICENASIKSHVEHVDLQPNSKGPIVQQPSNTVFLASGCLQDAKGIWYWFNKIE